MWLYDNSCDPAFHAALRSHAAALEGFHGVHVVRDDTTVTPELTRYRSATPERASREARRVAMGPISEQVGGIYSWAARQLRTDFVLFLEDDVVPRMGGDAVEALMRRVGWDTQAVYGWYRSRLGNVLVVDPPADGEPWDWRTPSQPRRGVTPVAGGGLGCVLLRGESVRDRRFKTAPHSGPDVVFSRELWHEGREMICDWEVECEHLT